MFLLDGAMGTLLQQQGYLRPGDCPELSNIEHPQAIENIHRSYIKAGSDLIQTNTFGANRIKLNEYGCADKVKEICRAAVFNAKKAVDGTNTRILGDMGPTGKFISPLGDTDFEDVYQAYYEQASILAESGVDLLLIQTIIDIQEMRAAILAAKEAAPNIPIMCEFSFSEDGRTITGTTPEAAAVLLESLGASIIGANCSLGPDKLIPLISRMSAVSNLPLVIQPNAGLPKLIDGKTVFPLHPNDMAEYVQAMVNSGATYIGGCCGTSPEHLAAMRQALDRAVPYKRKVITPPTALTSRTSIVYIGEGHPPVIIGERINPTGRKTLQKDLQEKNLVPIKTEALNQVKAGAHLLDINMGVPEVDQAALMENVVKELSMLVDTPLIIDATSPSVLEKALRIYPGRTLINSVNADSAQMSAIFPIAKKYGAALLCLPIGSKGIPESAADRLTLIKKIYNAALQTGLRHEDLLADPLVLTAAASTNAPKETLQTLRTYKETLKIPTVMGLSNISFGLPGRSGLNANFLAMALAFGLNAPIMNPLQSDLIDAYVRSLLLLGYDSAAHNYITRFQNQPIENQHQLKNNETLSPLKKIQQAVRDGSKEEIGSLLNEALNAGIDPMVITNDGLTAAMTAIGEEYGKGRCYLPQVMIAAETMQAAFIALKKALPGKFNITRKGPFVIATVKGDVHDLGKNIVIALLENSGYEVIDLGKDVSPEKIVSAVHQSKAPLVGLSALMTTTMPQIDITIQALKKENLTVKIIVGGAVLTSEYAQKAGADAYASNATDTVRLANILMGENQ